MYVQKSAEHSTERGTCVQSQGGECGGDCLLICLVSSQKQVINQELIAG